LAFKSPGSFDITFPLNGLDDPTDEKHREPDAAGVCELNSGEASNRHLLVNYHKPPFDNPEFRCARWRAAIDRQAFVDTIRSG